MTKSTTSIFDCEILYGTTFYDHIPLKFTFKFPDYEVNGSNGSCDSYIEDDQFIPWNKVNELDLLIYKDIVRGPHEQIEFLIARKNFAIVSSIKMNWTLFMIL